MFRRSCALLGSLLIILLSACALAQQGNNNTQPEAAEVSTALDSAPAILQSTPNSDIPSETITDTTRILRVWVPPALNGASDGETAVLTQQINNYALSQNDLEIIVETKVVGGQGGILSYLRTGRNIAPGILPDLIAIPAGQLSTVFADELIFPLTDLVEQTSIDNLYPAAQTFASSQNVLIGYPFALTQLTHFAYNSAAISQTINAEWGTLTLNESYSLAAPFGGTEGSLLVLQLYQAAGGTLINEAGQISLQAEPLALALDKLKEGVENDFLSPTLSQGATSAEMWDVYLQNRVNIIITTSEAYLAQSELETTAVSPVSGIDDSLTPIVNGWAWAISTPNSAQQQLAAQLITHLTSTESQSTWSELNHMLPANPDALAQWSIDSDYLAFIQSQLSSAEAISANATVQLLNLLQEAALQVISGDSSAQVAAEAAVDALQE